MWADRVDRRGLLLLTNSIAGAQALLLGLFVLSDQATLPIVYGMAFVLGVVSAVQFPAQQAFVAEVVGESDLANAVNVNLMTTNVARIIGPAVAGLTAATIGIAACFLLNAASFVAVIVAIVAIRPRERTPAPRQARQTGQLRDGIAHVRHNRELAGAWWMNLVYCMLAWEFEVSVPLLVTKTFGASADTYGLMFAALGAGAAIGGAWGASRHHPSHRDQLLAAMVSGAGLLGTALAPNLYVAFVTVAIGGGGIVCWWGILSGIYQIEIDDSFRAQGHRVVDGRAPGGPTGGRAPRRDRRPTLRRPCAVRARHLRMCARHRRVVARVRPRRDGKPSLRGRRCLRCTTNRVRSSTPSSRRTSWRTSSSANRDRARRSPTKRGVHGENAALATAR